MSRIAGLIRDRGFAHYFGNSDAADAFKAAFRIPNFLQNLFGEGVLSASFIPVYARLLAQEDEEEARRTAGAVAGLLALSTSVLVLIGVLLFGVGRAEAGVAGATRHGDLVAGVLCGGDGLKRVNDSAGHLAGNEVLVKIASDLRDSVRAEDIVARFGGDEFVLLLPRTGLLPAQASVSRIAQRLRDERYHWAGSDHPVPRVSFGIAWFPDDGRTADALLGAADARMYEDKARARETRDSEASGEE